MAENDINVFRTEIIQLRAWIAHWKADVQANLKPTLSSLDGVDAMLRNIDHRLVAASVKMAKEPA